MQIVILVHLTNIVHGQRRKLVIRSVSGILRAQSRFVKFVGGEYVSNRPYNEFITPTTFI